MAPARRVSRPNNNSSPHNTQTTSNNRISSYHLSTNSPGSNSGNHSTRAWAEQAKCAGTYIHSLSDFQRLTTFQQLRYDKNTIMATLPSWRHDMQRLWSLSQGPKSDAACQPKTRSSSIASRSTTATRTADDSIRQQKKFITNNNDQAARRSNICH